MVFSVLGWCHLAKTSSNILESSSHVAESSSYVAESSNKLAESSSKLAVIYHVLTGLFDFFIFCGSLRVLGGFYEGFLRFLKGVL
jgi:hypothetical protein